MNKIFSIPLPNFLSEKELFKFVIYLKKYKSLIYDIYYSFPVKPFEEDAFGMLKNNKITSDSIKYIKNETDLKMNLIFNNTQILSTIKNYDIFKTEIEKLNNLKFDSITIPFISWMKFTDIKKSFPNLKIKNTVLNRIKTPQEFYEIALCNYDYIVLDSTLVRNKDYLSEIKNIRDNYFKNIKLIIIMNEDCYGNCILKNEHRLLTIHRMNKESFFERICEVYCDIANNKNSSILKKASIYPIKTEIDYFLNYVDIIKLTGRYHLKIFKESLEIIKNYSNNKTLLLNVLFDNSKIFIDWLTFIKNCKFECYNCNYCEKIIKEVFNEKS